MISRASRDRKAPVGGGDSGFALLVVVFLLFAVGVAATAAYQVVFTEHRQSGFSTDSERARMIAEAGVNRFIGEAASGIPEDTDYFLDDGEAQVSTRKILDLGPWAERYRVHGVGRVTDPRLFDAPAIREVARYARFRAPPFNVLAPLVTTAGPVAVQAGFVVDGSDHAPAGACRQSQLGWEPWYHVVAVGSVTPSGGSLALPGQTAVLDSLNAPAWSALTDPGYPVDCPGAPGSGVCPSPGPGVFPVYRVEGDWNAPALSPPALRRGVLIVTGDITFLAGFQWDGIIIAGGVTSPVDADGMEVRGMVIAGMASPLAALSLTRGRFLFHSCNVAAAGSAMGVLNPEGRAFWSAF